MFCMSYLLDRVLQMERWIGKIAVVTGASSGIGEATARRLVESGLKVVGLARRVEKIQQHAKKLIGKPGKLYALKCDLLKEEEIVKSFKWIEEHVGPTHVLINCAGIARPTTLIGGCTYEWRQVIDINVLALCICTREAIESMQKHHVAGHIIHINSVCGHSIPLIPQNNVYPGTKHAVTALSGTLRMELNMAESKIKVTSISPGLVDTNIVKSNGFVFEPEALEAFMKAPKLQADDVADAVLYALGTKPHVMIQEMIIRPVGETL